jgi:curved DNA-binding protein
MDYYNILGITKTASQEQIKKAYRKLAMKNHPDRGGDEKHFQKISEAYDTLSDPAKRHQYDNPQPQFRFDSGGFRTNNNPFEDFMRGFAPGQRKNRDVTIQIKLNLLDVLQGKALTTRYKIPSGRIKEADIDIPPGVSNGVGIRFRDLGDDSNHILPPGDLIVKVSVAEHPQWKRNGNNLEITVLCTIFDCLLGGSVKIRTLEGNDLTVTIPKGTQANAKFAIPNYGVPSVKDGRRGSIIVKINPVVPNIENEGIIKELGRIKDALN